MNVIRPVRADDLDQLISLANLTSFGLTTLPRDAALLMQRIRESEQSFALLEHARPRGQAYLMVLEETESEQVVGTCGAVSKVGGFEPFYAYRIETSIQESVMLNVRKETPVLHLVAEHDGPSEIGSLFLHPDFRGGGRGRLLSLSRFLMMADFPHLFDRDVIAEMRGVIDERGHSPFWDALGRHFFDLEFPKADYLSIVNKEFIGDLMPVHPIYIPLLAQSAQEVIGEVHEKTKPARRLLEEEGFRFHQMIDIFEAGPILHCQRDQIRAVRDSRSARVCEVIDQTESAEQLLISNGRADFRVVQGAIDWRDSEAVLAGAAAEALQVSVGDTIRCVTPKSETPEGVES